MASLSMLAFTERDACTSIMVGKKASADGSVMTSHTCDSWYRTWMQTVPAKDHPNDTTTDIVEGRMHTEYPGSTDGVKVRGKIPQARHTFRYLDTAYPCLNEKQLAIGETTYSGREFIGSDSVCLILGDNIFHGSGFEKLLAHAVENTEKHGLATVFGYWVKDPERYGVAEFDKEGRCVSIEEKPEHPKSHYAVTGIYFYPNSVVDVAASIRPSARGELEITSVNQHYLREGLLQVQTLTRGFAWLDTGTHDSLADASIYVEVLEKRQGLKIACLEGIAFRKGWISAEKLRSIAQPMAKNQYGAYLLNLAEQSEHPEYLDQ